MLFRSREIETENEHSSDKGQDVTTCQVNSITQSNHSLDHKQGTITDDSGLGPAFQKETHTFTGWKATEGSGKTGGRQKHSTTFSHFYTTLRKDFTDPSLVTGFA